MPPPTIATGASIKLDYRKCGGSFQRSAFSFQPARPVHDRPRPIPAIVNKGVSSQNWVRSVILPYVGRAVTSSGNLNIRISKTGRARLNGAISFDNDSSTVAAEVRHNPLPSTGVFNRLGAV